MKIGTRIGIIVISFAIVAIWAILSFTLYEPLVQRFSIMISLIVGTGTLIMSFISFYISFLSYKRTLEIRKEKIIDDANKFIAENNSELDYIPLCIIANAYNKHHKFNRDIYNSFNVLSSEVQREILKQLNYEYELVEERSWINNGIKDVEIYINEKDLGRSFLYDGAKYFHRAMDYASENFDNSTGYAHVMPDKFSWSPKIYFIKDEAFKENISFGDYLDSYLNAKESIYGGHNMSEETKPINVLADVFNFKNCDEKILVAWLMEVVNCITLKLIKNISNGKENEFYLCRGDAEIQTYEDRYLEVLMDLYNLHYLKIHKSNKRTNK